MPQTDPLKTLAQDVAPDVDWRSIGGLWLEADVGEVRIEIGAQDIAIHAHVEHGVSASCLAEAVALTRRLAAYMSSEVAVVETGGELYPLAVGQVSDAG